VLSCFTYNNTNTYFYKRIVKNMSINSHPTPRTKEEEMKENCTSDASRNLIASFYTSEESDISKYKVAKIFIEALK